MRGKRRARAGSGGQSGRVAGRTDTTVVAGAFPATRSSRCTARLSGGTGSAVPLRALPPPVFHPVQDRPAATGPATAGTTTRRATHHVQVR